MHLALCCRCCFSRLRCGTSPGMGSMRWDRVVSCRYYALKTVHTDFACRTGSTTCVAGTTCTVLNDCESDSSPAFMLIDIFIDYSQCIPGAPASVTSVASTPPAATTSISSSSVIVPSPPPSTTSSAPAPTGSQIRAVNDPVFHFYLQENGSLKYLLVQQHAHSPIRWPASTWSRVLLRLLPHQRRNHLPHGLIFAIVPQRRDGRNNIV